jgi:cytochrome c-type biogenesis protein CcmH
MAFRIGRSGVAAIVAVAIAAGVIGYRIVAADNHALAAPAATASAPDSIADLQQHAEAAPQDAGAWQQLGFAQFDAGNYAEAAAAYEHATQVSPGNAVLWSSLGEARVMASEHDPMPAAALDAFHKAVALDPKDPRSRYFLAVEKDLKGDHKGAIADWLALLKDTPAGAPWDNDLQRTIEQVGKINKIDVASQIAAATANRPAMPPAAGMAIPGPTQDQLAAASSIPPSQQQAMAEGMVASLAAKMKANPANVDGWIMLMRSYRQLGREADAKAALASAVAANPAHADELRSAAASLALGPA